MWGRSRREPGRAGRPAARSTQADSSSAPTGTPTSIERPGRQHGRLLLVRRPGPDGSDGSARGCDGHAGSLTRLGSSSQGVRPVRGDSATGRPAQTRRLIPRVLILPRPPARQVAPPQPPPGTDDAVAHPLPAGATVSRPGTESTPRPDPKQLSRSRRARPPTEHSLPCRDAPVARSAEPATPPSPARHDPALVGPHTRDSAGTRSRPLPHHREPRGPSAARSLRPPSPTAPAATHAHACRRSVVGCQIRADASEGGRIMPASTTSLSHRSRPRTRRPRPRTARRSPGCRVRREPSPRAVAQR